MPVADVFGEGERNGTGDPGEPGQTECECGSMSAQNAATLSRCRPADREQAHQRDETAQHSSPAQRSQHPETSEGRQQRDRLRDDDDKTGPLTAGVGQAIASEDDLDEVIHSESQEHGDVDDVKEQPIRIRE